jgi:putative methyltransferase (TIGR04325 family)
MKKLIKSLIPNILIDLYRLYNAKKYGWFGDYKTWEEAENVCTGYDAIEIIQKVRESTLKVKNGKAIYERDSVIFDEIQYSWPILAGLMFASAIHRGAGALKVLDFGGSLGSTYFQNKKFLDKLQDVSWNIVEQKHFVDIGKTNFEDKKLKFYYDIESCIKQESPNVLLLSGVLQYIKKPYELLDKLLKNNFETILIDRTSFSKTKQKIKLQVVNPKIYGASYPCWFFDELEFTDYFRKNDYEIIASFESIDGKNKEYIFKGIIMKKNKKIRLY